MAIGDNMIIYNTTGQEQKKNDAADEMDSAGLQMLLLARYEARKASKAVCEVTHSLAVIGAPDSPSLYGMAMYLGDPMAFPAKKYSTDK